MGTPFLHQALRRAMIVSLAVPALTSAGCGGNVVTGQGGSTASSSSSSTTGGCTLASTTPIDANGPCSADFALVGPAGDCAPGAYGILTASQCAALCPPSSQQAKAEHCWANETDAGAGVLSCAYIQPCGTGRRPAGLAGGAGTGEGAGPVACFLREVATLEAASVVAFEQLAAELEGHGAPVRLVRAARRAAREEVRHARVMRRFAERAGSRPRPVEIAATPRRSLEAIAVDNAVEGCVRETFGAVLAMRQADRARSGDLRRAMKPIAREEAGHAALSWELARWLDGKLDEAARRRVRAAQARAVETLAGEATREPDARLVAELGLPTAAQARAAIDALRASIWAPRAHGLPRARSHA